MEGNERPDSASRKSVSTPKHGARTLASVEKWTKVKPKRKVARRNRKVDPTYYSAAPEIEPRSEAEFVKIFERECKKYDVKGIYYTDLQYIPHSALAPNHPYMRDLVDSASLWVQTSLPADAPNPFPYTPPVPREQLPEAIDLIMKNPDLTDFARRSPDDVPNSMALYFAKSHMFDKIKEEIIKTVKERGECVIISKTGKDLQDYHWFGLAAIKQKNKNKISVFCLDSAVPHRTSVGNGSLVALAVLCDPRFELFMPHMQVQYSSTGCHTFSTVLPLKFLQGVKSGKIKIDKLNQQPEHYDSSPNSPKLFSFDMPPQLLKYMESMSTLSSMDPNIDVSIARNKTSRLGDFLKDNTYILPIEMFSRVLNKPANRAIHNKFVSMAGSMYKDDHAEEYDYSSDEEDLIPPPKPVVQPSTSRGRLLAKRPTIERPLIKSHSIDSGVTQIGHADAGHHANTSDLPTLDLTSKNAIPLRRSPSITRDFPTLPLSWRRPVLPITANPSTWADFSPRFKLPNIGSNPSMPRPANGRATPPEHSRANMSKTYPPRL